MSDPDQPSPDRLLDRLEDGDHEAAAARLDRLDAAGVEARKRTVRALRPAAEERPGLFEAVVTPLAALLSDEDRAVRLTTAKLFVTLARSAPGVARPAVDALADRLADEAEFYYVRARCAEALGYVAVDSPEHVTDPETLADLRVGLAFDEPEVRRKLAKALAHVALGDPSRLRHQVSSLAGHLDDGNAHVRGRAAEALGVLAREQSDGAPPDGLPGTIAAEEAPFVVERVRFAIDSMERSGRPADTPDGVRTTTAEAVDAIESPDRDGACPQCGLERPEGAPPMCPRCGSPI